MVLDLSKPKMAKIKADLNLTTEHTAIRIWAAEKAEKIKMFKMVPKLQDSEWIVLQWKIPAHIVYPQPIFLRKQCF